MKTPSRIIPVMDVTEGAGVTVHRTIGTPALRHYDPFMLLDHISSENPDEYIAGFPSHPHRGFNTFTYMIDGDMEHKDSMGNTGNLGPGGAQWMKAASGIIHSEMPKQENGLMEGLQLWINLPADNKMDAPEYQEYKSASFPVVETSDYRVKVIIGHFRGAISPIEDKVTNVSYIDVMVEPEKQFNHALSSSNNSFLYLFQGSGQVNDQSVSRNTLITLGTSQTSTVFVAGEQGARFVLISGKPINESIVQYGPFVMNTRDEIDEAMRDFQSNHFVRERAWVNRS
ncbi:MAG: pirin family protein [gamma proteobacterium symbiont of Bathyaustriella thionipta]|nr:pirin family protein [gamma proteobacterium symbiont of Bathyaustriella thionipta]MCU7950624.1 pirin family protein [gamma proteobacterium symbiont of Bathyaustriella thionipta]MCU7954762.1 pirin family protein [gamma proteobacterium symbiont of Bathyaustriella thionipta]MCU7957121.1 pirin family protein [gamma proteobacterium symbiont of Bathyaustriella thionipta]MCU7967920.1 pirin family protein [gamma proteobacterium symbiont of Bathyaustriella thionipta]